MKNLSNILSYLWLLLLMAVTACSDLEEEVDPIQGEEEVELTIRTQVPGMKVGTRAAETENLTTITALVFNAEKELIKKVENIVTSTTNNTQGTFTLKVPLRTRSIHFIGNPTDVNLPNVPSEGGAAVTHDALKTLTTTGSLAYWGYASFADVAALRAYKNQTLTLYRNKAKISIEKAGTFNGSLAIAGLENVYKKGVLVPHNGDEFNFNLTNYDYQTLPTSVSDEEKGQEKYQQAVEETYVFEHPNDKENALFAICLINQKYYKVALAKNNSGTLSYYDIIRNHQYLIKINAINESLGQDTYDAAVNSDPINNAEAEVVEPEGLNIELDFYVDNADGGSGEYTNHNLQFGVTNLYLKVTIPENVAAGKRIELDMETGGTKEWINEWQSWDETLSSGVGYMYQEGVMGLAFTTEAGKRDYLMCWTFVRSDNNIKDEVPITYKLTSGTHTLSGETNANLTIKGNNKQIQVSAHDRPAAGKINISLPYGTDTTEEFTVDVVAPDGVTEMTIEAADFDVAWSDGNGNVSDSLTYNFPTKENLTHRFKFTLKEESKSVKTSNIYFSCGDKYVANGTVVVDLTERSADTVPAGGTTVWSGLAQLEWSVNYLSIPNTNTIAKGSTVRINFAQNSGTFKLHDGNGNAFKLGKEDGNYPDDDSYLEISQNYYEFAVNDITSGTDITNGLQGLKVNGNNVTVTSVVVYEGSTSNESVVYEVDFRKVTEWSLWCDPQDHAPTFDSENGFHLSNPQKLDNTWQPQYHLANGLALEAGTYKLTMSIRGDNAEGFDTKQLNIGLSCWTEGNSRPYTTMSFSDSWSAVSVYVTLSQNTTNSGADTDGFVMCQSGSFIGDLYIQWLRIEKWSQ